MNQTDKLKTELHALKVCAGSLLISILEGISIRYIVLHECTITKIKMTPGLRENSACAVNKLWKFKNEINNQ